MDLFRKSFRVPKKLAQVTFYKPVSEMRNDHFFIDLLSMYIHRVFVFFFAETMRAHHYHAVIEVCYKDSV